MLHQVDLILQLHLILCKCCVQTNLTAYLPSTPLTSSWSQSHTSTLDYAKHYRDRDYVSGVLRCDTSGWYETSRLCNFKEPENTCFNWHMMNKVSFTNSSWAANIFLSLHHSERNLQVLPLHCAWMSLLQNGSFPPHTSSCKPKTVSTTHPRSELCQPTTTWEEKKKYYGKNTASIYLFLQFICWERDFCPHTTHDAICILYIHTHSLLTITSHFLCPPLQKLWVSSCPSHHSHFTAGLRTPQSRENKQCLDITAMQMSVCGSSLTKNFSELRSRSTF